MCINSNWNNLILHFRITKLCIIWALQNSSALQMTFRIGPRGWHCSLLLFRQWTGTNIKKLILRKFMRMPKNLGADPFPDPTGHFWAPQVRPLSRPHVGHFGTSWSIFQFCRQWKVPSGAVLQTVSPLVARFVFLKSFAKLNSNFNYNFNLSWD